MKKNNLFIFIIFINCAGAKISARTVSSETSFFLKTSGGSVCESLATSYVDVSCLTWKLPFYIDFAFEEKISFFNFLCGIDLDFSWPNKLGTIEDRDFYLSGGISQFSKHENHLENNYFVCINLGYDFNFEKFFIHPFFGIKYQYRNFSAWDGYGQSLLSGESFTGDEEKIYFTGNGISYEQNIFIPFLKIVTNYKFKKDFCIEGTFNFAPYLFASCVDSHYFRNKEFFDEMKGGFSFSFEVEFCFKKIGFYFSYEYLKTSNNAKTWECSIGQNKLDKTLSEGYIPGIFSNILSFGISYSL